MITVTCSIVTSTTITINMTNTNLITSITIITNMIKSNTGLVCGSDLVRQQLYHCLPRPPERGRNHHLLSPLPQYHYYITFAKRSKPSFDISEPFVIKIYSSLSQATLGNIVFYDENDGFTKNVTSFLLLKSLFLLLKKELHNFCNKKVQLSIICAR